MRLDMKIFLFIILGVLSTIQVCFSQSNKEEIQIRKSFGGYKFSQNGIDLKTKQVKLLLKNDVEARNEFRSAESLNALATIFSITGGFIVGFQVGKGIVGGDINPTLIGVGFGLIVVSIPFALGGKKKMSSAIHIYNNNLRSATSKFSVPLLKIGMGKNGIGMILNF